MSSLCSSLLKNKAFINGNWVSAISGNVFEVKNPATGDVITTVPNMNEKDGQEAIDAAKNCFDTPDWRNLTAKQRSCMLKNWYRLVEENSQQIAEIMTAESGKPINESKGEIVYGNSFLEWFAEEARRIYGEIIPSPVPNRETIVIKQPLGVAALITPWNFPLAMITRKAGAALAAGCTVNICDLCVLLVTVTSSLIKNRRLKNFVTIECRALIEDCLDCSITIITGGRKLSLNNSDFFFDLLSLLSASAYVNLSRPVASHCHTVELIAIT